MDALRNQIDDLTVQIELEESNYRNAIERNKDYHTLRKLRDKIRALRERLSSCKDQGNRFRTVSGA